MQTISDVMYSKAKVKVDFAGTNITDALNFAFAYFDSEDHIVEYIVANGTVMKKVIGEIKDSVLNPEGQSLGELWTAKLYLSNKLKNNEMFFSNNTFSVVINLNLNSNSDEEL
jgi:hypothetical protein